MAEFADQPDQSCEAVDAIATRHLQEVERRIEQLQALRKELKRMIGECGMGKVSQCQIIETLADFGHRHCISQNHSGGDNVHVHVGKRVRR